MRVLNTDIMQLCEDRDYLKSILSRVQRDITSKRRKFKRLADKYMREEI